MSEIILTQYSGSILGPIARLLGWIMNGLYVFMDSVFGIQNVGLSIILLTIVIYVCLFPLTYKQQKFSKLSQKMQPELQAIQKKYKDKKDQESMSKMQSETSMVYAKYGVSMTGSCVQMLIQMPILFALYRVFLNVPAYVGAVKAEFSSAVDGIMATSGFAKVMTDFVTDMKLTTIGADFTGSDKTVVGNYIVDALYKMNTDGWDVLRDKFADLTDVLNNTEVAVNHFNNFLGLNIANSPWHIMTTSFSNGHYLMMIGALMIPVLSWVSQMLNIKLMPQASAGGNADAMANQMKTMNMMMPLFSFVMCFTVPVGLGIYWVAGAVIRSIQQFFLNKHFDKMNLEDIIKKNEKKAEKKREKMGIYQNQIANAAKMSTKANTTLSTDMSAEEKQEKLQKAVEYSKNAKPGSMASKANMVKEFNEKNNK